jgi:hypothetical protein
VVAGILGLGSIWIELLMKSRTQDACDPRKGARSQRCVRSQEGCAVPSSKSAR